MSEAKIQIGILVLSDRASAGVYEDESGPEAIEALKGVGDVAEKEVIPDDSSRIREILIDWSDKRRLDVIFTLGGTGFSARDVTPEATRLVLDRETPGITTALLLNGLEKTKRAMLSRAASGLRGHTLIVNLPGKPSAVRESIEYLRDVLPHAVGMAHGGDHE